MVRDLAREKGIVIYGDETRIPAHLRARVWPPEHISVQGPLQLPKVFTASASDALALPGAIIPPIRMLKTTHLHPVRNINTHALAPTQWVVNFR